MLNSFFLNSKPLKFELVKLCSCMYANGAIPACNATRRYAD